MKKIYKIAFLILVYFAFSSSVKALVCEYNFSGYKDESVFWTVDSTKSKPATQKGKLIGGLGDAGTEPVENWSSGIGGNSYKAENDFNAGKCPAYLIHTYNTGTDGHHVYMSDESNKTALINSNDVQETATLKADRSVLVFKLMDKTKDSSVATTCGYSYDGDPEYSFKLQYDKNGNLIGSKDAKGNVNFYLSYTAYEEKISAGACNSSAYMCFDWDIKTQRVFLNSYGLLNEDKTFSEDSSICLNYKYTEDLSKKEDGSPITVDTSCKPYSEYYDKMIAAGDSYQSCGNGKNCASYLKDFHQAEKSLHSFCQASYNVTYYSDTCVQKCVKLEEEAVELKTKYGIDYPSADKSACGISGRLISWLFKIISWIRYIVPIILIILSVLDFIKAFASDNSDDIKKVGTKFVRRLIVSAVIFLLPLMLEYALGIFGVPINDFCL